VLKIGVLGAGHLGKIHLRLIKEISDYELVGFFDADDSQAISAEKELGVKRFADMNELIDNADVVDIVTPTLSHFDCAVSAIKKSKHVFIEKPLANTQDEARQLIQLAKEADIKATVGHTERFNPAFLALSGMELHPMFIEAHCLAQFNPRGKDFSVVLDLMIHDLDIILSIVKSNVKKISASGVAICSNTPDIVNARIEFDNGCVANVTCSRIAMKQMRKIRLFQKNEYIIMDLLEKTTEIFRMPDVSEEKPNAFTIDTGMNREKKAISYEKLGDTKINSIKMELEMLNQCIREGSEPRTSLMDGYNAMQVACQVLQVIEKNKTGEQ